MKHILLLPLLLGSIVYAQNWQWVVSAGANKEDFLRKIAEDGAGNIIGIGEFNREIQLDHLTLGSPSNSTRKAFVAKWDSCGHIIWAVAATGPAASYVHALGVDVYGNIYVGGNHSGILDFGVGPTLPGSNGNPSFLARFRPDGTLSWLRSYGTGSVSNQFVNQILTDSSGAAIWATHFKGTATLPDTSYQASSHDDLLLLKYDSTGQILWHTHAGGFEDERFKQLEQDAQGNLYLTGEYESGNLTLGGVSVPTPPPNGHNAFIARYSANGILEWVRSLQTTVYVSPFTLGLSETGALYVSGMFASQMTVDTATYFSQLNLDHFLIRLDTQGQVQWVSQLEEYSTVSFGINFWLTDLEPGPNGTMYGAGVLIDTVRLGGTTFIGTPDYSLIIIQIDSLGQTQPSLFKPGNGGGEYRYIEDVLLRSPGNWLVAGSFYVAEPFGYYIAYSAGNADLFLAAYGACPAPDLQFLPVPDILCEGDTLALSIEDGGGGPVRCLRGSLAWYRDSVLLPNETAPTLAVAEAGNYSVSFMDSACFQTVFSPDFTLRVGVSVPEVLALGEDSLQSSVLGDNYQWFRNGQLLSYNQAKIPADSSGVYTVVVQESGCFSDTSAQYLHIATSLEPGLPLVFSLYPNPLTGPVVYLQTHLPGPHSLQQVALYDLAGKLQGLVRSEQTTSDRWKMTFTTMPPPGMYLLHIETMGRQEVIRLLVP